LYDYTYHHKYSLLKVDANLGISLHVLLKTGHYNQMLRSSESDPCQECSARPTGFAQIGRPKSWPFAAQESSQARRHENATNAEDESLVLDGLSGQTSSMLERGSRHDPEC